MGDVKVYVDVLCPKCGRKHQQPDGYVKEGDTLPLVCSCGHRLIVVGPQSPVQTQKG
jgi:DNA-directed RNA polymerase subunit RPC12/RpoP